MTLVSVALYLGIQLVYVFHNMSELGSYSSVLLPYSIKAKRCMSIMLWVTGRVWVLALCLTKVRSSPASCPATAFILLR